MEIFGRACISSKEGKKMEVTRAKTFSDADLEALCENCDEALDGGVQLWNIDHDHSYGWFCSRDCAQHYLVLAGIDDLDCSDEEKEALREIDDIEGLQAETAEAALDWFRDCHDRHTFKVTTCTDCKES